MGGGEGEFRSTQVLVSSSYTCIPSSGGAIINSSQESLEDIIISKYIY